MLRTEPHNNGQPRFQTILITEFDLGRDNVHPPDLTRYAVIRAWTTHHRTRQAYIVKFGIIVTVYTLFLLFLIALKNDRHFLEGNARQYVVFRRCGLRIGKPCHGQRTGIISLRSFPRASSCKYNCRDWTRLFVTIRIGTLPATFSLHLLEQFWRMPRMKEQECRVVWTNP